MALTRTERNSGESTSPRALKADGSMGKEVVVQACLRKGLGLRTVSKNEVIEIWRRPRLTY